MRTDPLPGFTERWAALSAERSPLCLGVAPSDKWLAAWNLPAGVSGARAFCEAVLTSTGSSLAVFKVQTPFFTRFGPEGVRLLRWFTDRAHDHGSLVLLDAKVGDADDTMDAHADLYLGPDSVLGATPSPPSASWASPLSPPCCAVPRRCPRRSS
ncbi:orotidine 5'-phosphate decarboxylase [Nocardiopsis sp. ARC36]